MRWLGKNDVNIPIGFYIFDSPGINPVLQSYIKKLYSLTVFLHNLPDLKSFCSKYFFVGNDSCSDESENGGYDLDDEDGTYTDGVDMVGMDEYDV